MQIGIFSGFRSSRMTCIAIGISLASTMALVRGDNRALLEAAADPRHAWETGRCNNHCLRPQKRRSVASREQQPRRRYGEGIYRQCRAQEPEINAGSVIDHLALVLVMSFSG